MKRLLSLAVLLLAGVASAQQILIRRLVDATLETYTFGTGQCRDTLSVQWTATLLPNLTQCASNGLKLWVTEGTCSDAPSGTDVSFDTVSAATVQLNRNGNFTVDLTKLPGFASTVSDGGMATPCGTTGITKTHKVCGALSYSVVSGFGCGTAMTLQASPLTLVYDTQPPTAPTLTDKAAQSNGVKVTFTSNDSDTATVILEAGVLVDDGGTVEFATVGEAAVANGVVFGKGMRNGVPYAIRLRAVDAAGNVSDPSGQDVITPIDTLGFYGEFRRAGGEDLGGCSTGAGLIPLLVGLFALRRARAARSNPS
ncbi:MAG: MXAN_2561 family MXYO-CTERM-anchored protein [Myxococcota bacterium]